MGEEEIKSADNGMFSLRTVVNLDEVEEQMRADRRGGLSDADNMPKETPLKYMYMTSMYVDWDRRRSVNKSGATRENEKKEAINCYYGSALCKSCMGIYGTKTVVDVKNLTKRTRGKISGIVKLRRAGRFEVKYFMNRAGVMNDIMNGKMELVRRKREMEVMDGRNDERSMIEVENNLIEIEGQCRGENNMESMFNGSEQSNPAREDVVDNEEGNEGNDDEKECAALKLQSIEMRIRAWNRKMNGTKRRTRRDRIDSNKFRLTEAVRLSKRKDGTYVRTEEEMFKDACNFSAVLIGYICRRWIEVPHLRCVHIKEKSRQMVSLCTARVRETISE